MKKIVILCHFTNEEIQKKLPLWKKSNEFASWMPNILKGLSQTKEYEFHVISPHNYLKKDTYFKENNIYYYFLTFGIPILSLPWPHSFPLDAYSNYSFFKFKVNKIVNKINPSLINLIGAENAYYSGSILQFKDRFPVLITIQGFIGQLEKQIELNYYQKKRIEIENKIHQTFKYFAGEMDSKIYLNHHNPNFEFFKLYFPTNEVLYNNIKSDEENRFDMIYYGRISVYKGVEEFVKVVGLVKKNIPNIKACIIGPGDLESVKKLAQKLNCYENIDFKGFIATQFELFEVVRSSKVFLAPPFFERLSATIREAMFLKVPVVAYSTGGIPYINEFDENIKLVETGDYEAMAKESINLLQNETLREQMKLKAYNYAWSEFSIGTNTDRLLKMFETVMFRESGRSV